MEQAELITNGYWQIPKVFLTNLKIKFVLDKKYISAHYVKEFERYLKEGVEYKVNEEDFDNTDYYSFNHFMECIKIGLN